MATIEKETTIQGLSPKLDSKLVWKNGQPRIFQLIGTGTLDTFNADVTRNIKGLEIKRPGAFPAETTIYDEADPSGDKTKVIRNITGKIRKQKENGEAFFEDQVEMLRFDNNGQCIVQPGQKNLLARVMLSDNCGTNPYRRPNAQILWEEVKDHTLEKQEIIRNEELKDFARSQVKSMDMSEVKAMLLKYNPNYAFGNKNSGDLKYDLRLEAEKDPRYFLSNSPDEAVKMSLNVDDALADGIISHDYDSKSYFLDGKAILVYKMEEAEDPKAALVKHLLNNKNKADRERLLALLKSE